LRGATRTASASSRWLRTRITKRFTRSWSDIAQKKPRMRLTLNRPDNPQGSIGGPYELMKVHGFTIDDIPKWGGSFVLGNSSVSIDAIKDGKADVMTGGGILGNSLVKDAAKTRDVGVQALARSRRRLIAPEVVDQSVGRDCPVRLEQQSREQRLQLVARDGALLAADEHLEGAENAELAAVCVTRHPPILGRYRGLFCLVLAACGSLGGVMSFTERSSTCLASSFCSLSQS